MAELRVEGDEVVLHLTRVEEFEAVRGDLRAPLSSIRGVEVLDDAHEPADHGFKVGERLPGHSEVAAVRTGGRRFFAAVHHDTPRGVRVAFDDGADFDAWIIGCAEPETVAAGLRQHLSR